MRLLELFSAGMHRVLLTRPEGIARYMVETRPLFVLVREGERPRDSRFIGKLRCSIEVGPFRRVIRPGGTLSIWIHARNIGDTVWLSQPREYGGFVTFASKLLHPDGLVVTDTLGRTRLPHDVRPGGSVSSVMKIRIPPDLPPGDYALTFDMVDEWVCWFSAGASEPPPAHRLRVVAS